MWLDQTSPQRNQLPARCTWEVSHQRSDRREDAPAGSRTVAEIFARSDATSMPQTRRHRALVVTLHGIYVPYASTSTTDAMQRRSS